MANSKIILKKSSVAAKVPLTTDLAYGELAINYEDGKLYFKTAANAITSFNTSLYIGTTLVSVNRASASQSLTGVSIDGSAANWTTARTISLAGDVSGSVAIDGSANVSLTTSAGSAIARRDAANTFSGAQTFSNAVTMSATTENIAIATSQTTGTLSFGGTTQTGLITLGQSTDSQNVSIGSGILASTKTRTINIGANGATGSTTNVNIGTTASAGAPSNVLIGSVGSYTELQGGFLQYGGEFFIEGDANTYLSGNQATASVFLGGQLGTGSISLGRSTKTQTVDIATGSTESGLTKTVNVGSSGAAGSFTNINIGSAVSSSTINVYGATNISGALSATTVNKVTVTAPATGSTLTIANGKTLTASNTLTLAGTDATTMTFPSTSASIARTDATQTFSGAQSFNNAVTMSTTTDNILIGTSQSTGTTTIGGITQTGLITIGRSNDTQTVDIAGGNVGSAKTKTVYIAYSATAGTGSNTLMYVGPTSAPATFFIGQSTVSESLWLSSGSVATASTKAVNIGTGSGTGVTNITIGPTAISAGSSTLIFGQSARTETIQIGTGASASGITKLIQIGTNGAAGSTTTITVGSTAGTSTITMSGAVTMDTATSNISIGASQTTGTLTLGGTSQTGTITVGGGTGNKTITIENGATTTGNTLAINIGTGVTASGSTRNIRIGTNGAAGSTTSVVIGAVVAAASTVKLHGYVTGQVSGIAEGLYPNTLLYRLNGTSAGADVATAQALLGVGVSVAASTQYIFRGEFALSKTLGAVAHDFSTLFGGTATLNNISYAVQYGTGATSQATATTVSSRFYAAATAGVLISGIASATQHIKIRYEGTVSFANAGTFIPQYILSAAPGGGYTTQPGCYFEMYPIGASGANLAYGTWA